MHRERPQYPKLLVPFEILALVATSCSTGPQPPQMGTPAFYWQAANETFAQGDYVKANSHLEQLIKTDNEFTERALPWRLMLTSGMVRGYAQLADTFENGARANNLNPMPFRKHSADYRIIAGRLSLQFVETSLKFSKSHNEQSIPIAFSYPTGSAAEVKELSKIGFGAMLQPSTLDSVERKVIERAVLLSACDLTGAQNDVAKAQAILKSANPQVAHDTFMVALARNLHDLSGLYSRTKLDQPDRVELFCNHALETLKTVKETKETKNLTVKIEKTLKGLKSSRTAS